MKTIVALQVGMVVLAATGCVGSGLFPNAGSSHTVGAGSGADSGDGSDLDTRFVTSTPTSLLVASPNPSFDKFPWIIGDAASDCLIQLFSNSGCTGVFLGSGTPDSSGAFAIQTSQLADGSYQISARCIDSKGATHCSSSSVAYTVDTVGPSVALSSPSRTITSSSGSISYTVNYSGAALVTLAPSNISQVTTGGATCASKQVSVVNSTTATVTLSQCSGNGTIAILLAGGTAQDTAGNAASASQQSASFAVDNDGVLSAIFSPPSNDYGIIPATIEVQLPESIDPASILASSFVVTGSCPGVTVDSATPTGASVLLSLSGTSGCGLLDTVTLSVALSSIQDIAGNPGSGVGSVTFRVNNVGPTSATFGPSSGVVQSMPSSVAVTFDDVPDATTVTAADFSVGGSCAGVNVSGVVTVGAVSTVSLAGTAGCTHAQTVTLSTNMLGMTDIAGNLGVGIASATWTRDTTGPAVTILPATSTRKTIPTIVSAVFSSDTLMTDVTVASVHVSGTCAATSIGSIDLSGATASINLNGTTGCTNGETVIVTIDLTAIHDAVGNAGIGSQAVTYTRDTQAPAALLSLATGTTSSLPSALTVTFSPDTDMQTVLPGAFQLGGNCGSPSISSLSAAGNVVTANLAGTLSCINGNTLQMTVDLTNVSDLVGNVASGNVTSLLTLDTSVPAAILGKLTGNYNPLPTSIPVTFSPNTDMGSVSIADFNLAGSCAGTSIGSVVKTGNVATVNLSGTGACVSLGTAILNVDLSGVQSLTGNWGTGTPSAIYTLDTIGPLSSLSVSSGTYNPLPTSVTVTLSADTDMSTVTSADFTVTGTCATATVGGVSISGQNVTVGINGTTLCASLSTVIFTTLLTGIKDLTGNSGVGTQLATFIYDNIGPTLQLSVAVGNHNPLPASVQVTFSTDTDMSTVSSSNFTLLGTCLGASIGSISKSSNVVTVNFSNTGTCVLLQTLILTTNLVGVKDQTGNPALGVQAAVYTKL